MTTRSTGRMMSPSFCCSFPTCHVVVCFHNCSANLRQKWATVAINEEWLGSVKVIHGNRSCKFFALQQQMGRQSLKHGWKTLPPGKDRWHYNSSWFIIAPYKSPPFGSSTKAFLLCKPFPGCSKLPFTGSQTQISPELLMRPLFAIDHSSPYGGNTKNSWGSRKHI